MWRALAEFLRAALQWGVALFVAHRGGVNKERSEHATETIEAQRTGDHASDLVRRDPDRRRRLRQRFRRR